jgi:mRNA-degrading endonuclease RelE of RelBE toxin-antitoxin system
MDTVTSVTWFLIAITYLSGAILCLAIEKKIHGKFGMDTATAGWGTRVIRYLLWPLVLPCWIGFGLLDYALQIYVNRWTRDYKELKENLDRHLERLDVGDDEKAKEEYRRFLSGAVLRFSSLDRKIDKVLDFFTDSGISYSVEIGNQVYEARKSPSRLNREVLEIKTFSIRHNLDTFDTHVSREGLSQLLFDAPFVYNIKLDFESRERRVKSDWRIIVTSRFKKAIKNLDKDSEEHLLKAVDRILTSPREPMGNTIMPLSNDKRGLWRYRLGNSRILYEPHKDAKQIIFVDYGDRSGVYK